MVKEAVDYLQLAKDNSTFQDQNNNCRPDARCCALIAIAEQLKRIADNSEFADKKKTFAEMYHRWTRVPQGSRQDYDLVVEMAELVLGERR